MVGKLEQVLSWGVKEKEHMRLVYRYESNKLRKYTFYDFIFENNVENSYYFFIINTVKYTLLTLKSLLDKTQV